MNKKAVLLMSLILAVSMTGWTSVYGETSKTVTKPADTISASAVPDSIETLGQKVVTFAQEYIDVDYKYGGVTKDGFDASGFTKFVYKNSDAKMILERSVAAQFKQGQAIGSKSLKAGDLIFFKTDGKTASLVGIYVGNNEFIAATTKGVRVQSLTTSYYKKAYLGAKRMLK
ncbi:C40 family peptidase [Paenibacillus sp. IHBB 10380]|uniref:C40 family peptidase n=1 Tax=Paenibacillus sp. IHBB 10380 TaxID=1566358 RepID=UPI0006970984|nr:C40 family peptidase [Paenibacillus sp. IHBB 10380]